MYVWSDKIRKCLTKLKCYVKITLFLNVKIKKQEVLLNHCCLCCLQALRLIIERSLYCSPFCCKHKQNFHNNPDLFLHYLCRNVLTCTNKVDEHDPNTLKMVTFGVIYAFVLELTQFFSWTQIRKTEVWNGKSWVTGVFYYKISILFQHI